jgi:predicted ATP-dependent endonuclease of OLD family
MKLDRVSIRNFRSIKELTFDFNPSFKILVGKNESGKSNIIRALSLLDKSIKPTLDDKREFLPNENISKDYHVWFIFKLNENEIKDILKILNKEFLINESTKIINHLKNEMTLMEFCKTRNEGLCCVDIENSSKDYSYWAMPINYAFLPNIKRHINYVARKEGEALTLFNSFVVNTNELNELNKDEFIDVKVDELNKLIGSHIVKLVEENLPKTIYWQYDENNLLPNKINLENFIADPNICMPLKVLFNFAGYDDIKTVITEAKKATGNQFDNLLKRVSTKATNHFKEVWKEYPDISFSFTHNGENIIASIQEENKYPLAQRSDGFKRFVTFLILISACAKNNDLENTLILFDEPDVSLHPSGIRFLRDELIRVSKNNLIVASTHSIFMIDNDNIDRHLIVTKEKEVTQINKPTDTDIFEEEVLYKAVGYSLYEIMRQKNIVFEGWRDKKLYKTAIENCPPKYKVLCKKLVSYGYCQSNGVKGVKTLTPIFESINRKCIIVTDADEPAKERKMEYEKIKGIGAWKTYLEIDDSCFAITGEDFLKIEYVISKITKLKKQYSELKKEPDFKANTKGVIYNVNNWLISQKKKEEVKPIVSEFKSLLFDNLDTKNIDNKYFKFLQKLQEVVEKL